MPVVKHTKPCSECPFRKASAPGWLGASTPEEFMLQTFGEVEMPCHCAIDYEQPDWQEAQAPNAPFCAGALIMLKNNCKRPVSDDIRLAMEHVECDRGNVFSFVHEFLEHHGSEPRSFFDLVMEAQNGN